LIQLFGQQTTYTYFKKTAYAISPLENFGGDLVYEEWMTFDVMEDHMSRTAMSVWVVFTNVGGI